MMFLVAHTASAWIGSDGAYEYSETGAADPNAPAFEFIDIANMSGTVTLSNSTSDDSTISIGAQVASPVTFYNTTYMPNEIFVSTNGVVGFDTGTSDSFCCSGQFLPTSDLVTGIFPLWSDLNPGSGGDILVNDDGTVLIIQYDDVHFFGDSGDNLAQMVFDRATGEIRINHDYTDPLSSDTVTVGIQGDTTFFLQAYNGGVPAGQKTYLFRPDETDDDGDGFAGIDDCNDADATISPNAVEICDGIDNNCNGITDSDADSNYYPDMDGDGFGDASLESMTVEGCVAVEGFGPGDDCDDDDPDIRPNAPELCDAIDQNCDGDPQMGAIDTVPYRMDADGDGWGTGDVTRVCEPPNDAATEPGTDCDDDNPQAFPGATEIPYDDVDNNCDGLEDRDRDDDGFNDSDEAAYGSDPNNEDTDGDGLLDGFEYQVGGNLLAPDSDSDGIGDNQEVPNGVAIDSDGDGDNDIFDSDDDGDGWFTLQEGTVDTDGDGTPDYLDLDSDGDGVPDADETPRTRLVPNDTIPGFSGTPPAEACGCNAGPSQAGFLLFPLVMIALRRRT